MSQCHLWLAIRHRRWGHWGRLVRRVPLCWAGLSQVRSSGDRGARWSVEMGVALALVVRCLGRLLRGLGVRGWRGGGWCLILLTEVS